MEEVLLVDEQDRVLGVEEKLRAHRDGGRLHRAFSILICDTRGRMLLQLRSRRKYHFGGLWTNACCGHPRPGEAIDQAAHRRLHEELGFDVPLREIFTFVYRAEDPGSDLTEHEYDHVFLGVFEGTPHPDPEEIDEYKWMEPVEIDRDLGRHPEQYSPWFPLAFAGAAGHFPTGRVPSS
jgi:isopentenyl-diphosphate delta-isomerase